MVVKQVEQCQVGTRIFRYFYVLEERKHVRITVQPNRDIVVYSPRRLNSLDRQNLVKKKWQWITRQQTYFGQFSGQCVRVSYAAGSEIMYLGRQYRLKVVPGGLDTVRIARGEIYFYSSREVSNLAHNKKILEAWLRQKIESTLRRRYKLVCKKQNIPNPPLLKIKRMSKRWGSFVENSAIYLNPELTKSSLECIDYVITHELLHIRYKKHNREFYSALTKKIPEWEKIKFKLESYS